MDIRTTRFGPHNMLDIVHEREQRIAELERERDAMRTVVDAAKAWREDWHDGTGAPDDKALATAVDKLEGKCDGF
jgi:hypothetical protein